MEVNGELALKCIAFALRVLLEYEADQIYEAVKPILYISRKSNTCIVCIAAKSLHQSKGKLISIISSLTSP